MSARHSPCLGVLSESKPRPPVRRAELSYCRILIVRPVQGGAGAAVYYFVFFSQKRFEFASEAIDLTHHSWCRPAASSPLASANQHFREEAGEDTLVLHRGHARPDNRRAWTGSGPSGGSRSSAPSRSRTGPKRSRPRDLADTGRWRGSGCRRQRTRRPNSACRTARTPSDDDCRRAVEQQQEHFHDDRFEVRSGRPGPSNQPASRADNAAARHVKSETVRQIGDLQHTSAKPPSRSHKTISRSSQVLHRTSAKRIPCDTQGRPHRPVGGLSS